MLGMIAIGLTTLSSTFATFTIHVELIAAT
jgi:hypothetical protein